jgi:hypothetical protein
MDAFLGKESFPGPSVGTGTRTASGSYAGQAHFNGCIAFCNWRREEVAAVLPDELELAPNRSTTAELHPVAFVFGEQTEGATIFGGVTFRMGVNYHECAFAIPFVKHRRGRYLHTFVPRMYSSFFPATWVGNAHYGFGKEMGTMRWDGSLFTAASADGTTILRASIEPTGEWVPAPRCDLPNFAAMRAVFGLPVVGRRTDGTYVTSYFGWDFGAARVRPARAAISIVGGLARGVNPRSCATVASGTFEVRSMIWRLSWPVPCRF